MKVEIQCPPLHGVDIVQECVKLHETLTSGAAPPCRRSLFLPA